MRILWLNFSRCLFTVSRSLIYIKFSISARVDIRLLIFIQFSCKYPIRPLVCISGLHLIPASLQVYLKILSSIEITLSTNLREISRNDDFDTSSSAEWEISIKKNKKNQFLIFPMITFRILSRFLLIRQHSNEKDNLGSELLANSRL